MQSKKMKVALFEPNLGQIDGLPINPRQWSKGDVEKMAASLKQTPELFEARPVIAVEHDGKYIILGGNLRFEGAKHLGMGEIPAIILPKSMTIEKMKEIVLKDNSSMGAWDFDELANKWSDMPLSDWGIPSWKMDEGRNEDRQDEDNSGGGEDKEKGYNIQYVLVFNNEDEQDRWYAFLAMLKAKYPDVETISERVLLETDRIVRDAD